jgi:proteic killer suppression protein
VPIKSFRHKGLRRLFENDDRRGIPAGLVERIIDVLAALDTAQAPGEVSLFPGWRLHPLKGALKGTWSVTISGNWRITFRFEKGDARDVDLTDYH